MPTELEELVGFIAHPNPQIRKLAVENLVGYSQAQPAIFKTEGLTPIKHLKFLVKDHPKIAEHVLTILVNLTAEKDVLENVAKDDKFIGEVADLIVKPNEPNANLMAMLLANLAKYDGLKTIVTRKQTPPEELKSNDLVLNQLIDLFVKEKGYNKDADYDYLAYLFADLTKHAEVRQHFVTRQDYDEVIPITKLKVFTEHASEIRRKGVASTIKNVAFEIQFHPTFLDEDEVDILPYILLPITGNEEYDDEDTMGMLPDLQLLPPDKKRDSDPRIIQTHIETLLLLTTTREARDLMRRVKVYPIIRETHLRVEDEGVKDTCDRLVQVIMSDEAPEEGEGEQKQLTNGSKVEEIEDDDNEIVEV
ncbi:Protein HGH1-like protein [Colletotrichum siamense]|nr:Protein HGH1-like protein [Colletotrichum siamense]KAF4826291.1 Protein HGH1-like protein [Colletotrichum tropicale]KAI8156840.1 Protein HGH1-like protein [Colletotrichum sp. SAR 10_71]KAI8166092.1 Protein HGH1-like protein [Colletotrichum sp. SAR 10_70]KAI8171251.1 Protein HGH1-like protein [Colletotrichum sp. SAR 10_65]KAI8176447.1 Protein HGH1-like protein [Colletotrichum sp. SAR 10_75]KAI8204257.1 Protein HGH1-like protein [Colletotrichum sp. SAR 10_76]KAI8224460.1 Protein HGH1-like p